LKKDFPNKVIVGSIMAAFHQKDWEELAAMCVDAKFDVV